ncbi:MAG: hypothetical protein ACLP1X_21035 [Polyangiaceae bacterium]|jgi:hypothetical protein
MLTGRMPYAALRSLVLVGACLVASCGGATPPPAPPVPVQPVAVAPLPPPPDLSPAPEPPGLIVSGRLGKLSGLLATVRGWSNLPMPQSEQVTELLTGQAVGPLVDLEQTIDFAVASTGGGTHMRAQVAVSAGIKDIDAAKAALSDRYKLAPGENGALLIQGLDHRSSQEADDIDSDGDDGDHRACELVPAFGAAAMRIVCGMDAKSLADLAPWLTRTATRSPSTSDLRIDVRLQALKPTIAGFKRMFSVVAGGVLGEPSGVPGLRDAAISLGTDLVDFVLDLETISVDVQLSDAGAGLTATTRFSGNSSAFTRVVTAHADGGSPTPAAFWQMPGDADSAAFYRGLDANDLARVRDLALKLLDAKLAEDTIKEADRKVLVDALAKVPSSAPATYASGVDLDAVKKARGAGAALGSSPDPIQEIEARRGLAEALLGWHLLELDEPSSRLSAALKEVTTAWSRPGLLGAYRAKAKGGVTPAIRMAPVPKGTTLPKDTQHYVIELPFEHDVSSESHNVPPPAAKGVAKASRGRPRALLVHLFLAAEGPRTWLAVGGDDALVVSKLSSALTTGQTNARSDLGFFRDARTGSAGFSSLRSAAAMAQVIGVLFSELGLHSDDSLEDLTHVPHGGRAPIVYSLTAQTGVPSSVVATLQVPRAAIEDAVVGVLRHGGF